MKSHKDLEVWRLAIDFASDVYEVTRTFPKDEQFGMIIQMRRSANSIASNIAEDPFEAGIEQPAIPQR